MSKERLDVIKASIETGFAQKSIAFSLCSSTDLNLTDNDILSGAIWSAIVKARLKANAEHAGKVWMNDCPLKQSLDNNQAR